MSHRLRPATRFDNLFIAVPDLRSGGAYALAQSGAGVTPGTGAAETRLARQISHEQILLQGVAPLALSAGTPYASYLAATFPASKNLLLLGAHLKGTFTLTAGQVASNYAMALGSVATASANFANAGEKAYLTSRTPTGAGVNGTFDFSTVANASPGMSLIPAGTNKIYINVGYASLAANVNLQFGQGSILDLFFYDLETGA
jgi:hypothetical protein